MSVSTAFKSSSTLLFLAAKAKVGVTELVALEYGRVDPPLARISALALPLPQHEGQPLGSPVGAGEISKVGKQRMKEPLGSIENAQQYLDDDLWPKWSAEQQRIFHACAEVAVMMLAAVDENPVFAKHWKQIYRWAQKMRELDPGVAKFFLRDNHPPPEWSAFPQAQWTEKSHPPPEWSAFPQAYWAAEMILQDPRSVAHDHLVSALHKKIPKLVEDARDTKKSALAYIAAYVALSTEGDMPSGNMLAALSVIHGLEDPTRDGHDVRFANWKTAKADARKKINEIGLILLGGTLIPKPD